MKKYILFFLSIGLLISIVFILNTINVEESRKMVFAESGYVFNGSASKFYFNEDETYTTSYDDKIVFSDVEGEKVAVDNDNFIHYVSGNIVTLHDSVLLDLSRISDDPITYYNVGKNKEIRKLSNKYSLKNLSTDIQFEQAIWKVSPNKYIVLGNNFNVILNNGTKKKIEDYVEVEYTDNAVINIYNQEVKYQTISSNSFIELSDNIKLNLGTKIVSKNDENKMTLENMVINSDDNITIVDINEKEEPKNEIANNVIDGNILNTVDGNQVSANNVGETSTSTTTTNTSTTTNSGQTIINNSNTVNENTINNNTVNENTINNNTVNENTINNNTVNENTINNNTINENTINNNTISENTINNNTINTNTINENTVNTNTIKENTVNTNTIKENTVKNKFNEIIFNLPEIIYEYVEENETQVDETVALAEPVFRIENMQTSAVGVTADIQIVDEEDLLSKEKDITVKIINNSTGKVVYLVTEAYGTYSIPIQIETLIPNTQYTIIASADYVLSEKEYSKNFINKTFTTLPIGIEMTKEAFTDSSLTFNVSIKDPLVSSYTVGLYDANGTEIPNRNINKENPNANEIIEFEELESNTNYIVKVSKIVYGGAIQEGENWLINYNALTLKSKAIISELNYEINKRDSTFRLFIEGMEDKNNAIQDYRFMVYNFDQDITGEETSEENTNVLVYQKETNGREITVNVGDGEQSGEPIIREHSYRFKVIATMFDNEKYVEVESGLSSIFSLSGKQGPRVQFIKDETNPYQSTEIKGELHIIDNFDTIIIDGDNPLTISYASHFDERTIYKTITSFADVEKTEDNDGNTIIKIPVDLGGPGNTEKGLSSETTYTFSVNSTIDLKDGYGERSDVFIGSAIVSTTKYDKIIATLENVQSNVNTFSVKLLLNSSAEVMNAVSSIDIVLRDGSGDLNDPGANKVSLTINNDNADDFRNATINPISETTYIKNLKELLFDNGIILKPSLIGGGRESDYKEAMYTIAVTATIDGTKYPNKIPIEVAASASDKDKGNVVYEKNIGTTARPQIERYDAAWIYTHGIGTVPEIDNNASAIVQEKITNAIAKERYKDLSNNNLDDNTVVGIMIGTNFRNTGSLSTKKITYYVWDSNGNIVMDDGQPMIQEFDFTGIVPPSIVYQVKDGTLDSAAMDNLSGIHRGNKYFFSYTVTYDDGQDGEIIWPNPEEKDENGINFNEKTMRSSIIPIDKQEPKIEIYPTTSDAASMTFNYKCSDYDKALEYTELNKINIQFVNADENNIMQNEMIIDEETHSMVFTGLTIGKTYKMSYDCKLQKDTILPKLLVTQLFEGIKTINSTDIIITKVPSGEINKDRFQLNVDTNVDESILSRITAVQLTYIDPNNEAQITSKLLKPVKENGEYYVEINYIDFCNNANFVQFIEKDLNLTAKLYYDSGVTGFTNVPNGEWRYLAYVTFRTDNDGKYHWPYFQLENNQLIRNSEINGDMFKSYNNELDKLKLISRERINEGNDGVQNAVTFNLTISPKGFLYNDMVVVQKQIQSKDISYNELINIDDIGMGIKLNGVNASISTADVTAELDDPLNKNIQKLVIELWHSASRNEKPNWQDTQKVETIEINVNNLSNFKLENLEPKNYYYMRFKYLNGSDYSYTYDYVTKEVGKVYQFETLATVGIKDGTIDWEYSADNYYSKYLKFSYELASADKSVLYDKTMYTFYEVDEKGEKTKLILPEDSVITNSTHHWSNGSLVVDNPKDENGKIPFTRVNEKISISPEYNNFKMGNDYILEIMPIVVIEKNGIATELKIEAVEKRFNMKELTKPSVALSMARVKNSDYVKLTVTIKNNPDKTIYSSKSNGLGEYKLKIYKYKGSIDNKVEVTNDIYNDNSSATAINLSTFVFNEVQHGNRYPIYILDSENKKYNYIAELSYKLDTENKVAEAKEQKVESKLNAIDNDYGISTGSYGITHTENKIRVRFYNSLNLTQVNKITYSILKYPDTVIDSSTISSSGDSNTIWTTGGSEDEQYYYFEIPKALTEKGTYIVIMNLYVGEDLVGQIDPSYIYE